MQILRLKFCNLASLAGEHCIDFQKEPLKSAGLIAITGRTGAGKSTLLDALCLALYNKIPRFHVSKSQMHAIEKYNNVTDVRQILTKGMLSAYAEVEFIGIDQKRYICRTEIQHYRDTTKGLKNNTRKVISVDEQNKVLFTNITECNKFVVDKTGLKFEQFTRTVLLAQSEITAFLKAPDHERAQLLEHLTGSSIFKKIGELASIQYTKIKTEYQDAQRILGMIEVLPPEQLAQKQEDYQLIQQQLKHIQQEIEQYEQYANIHLNYQKYQSELQQYQNKIAELNQVNIQLDKQKLNQYEQFQRIESEWKRQTVLEHQCEQAKQNIQQLEQEIHLQQLNLAQMERELQQISQQHHQQLPDLNQQISNIKQVLEKHTIRINLRAAYEQKIKEINQHNKNLEQIVLELKNIENENISLEQNKAKLKDQLEQFHDLSQCGMLLLPILQEYQETIDILENKIKAVFDESLSAEQWFERYQHFEKSYTQFKQKEGDQKQIQNQYEECYKQLYHLKQQQQSYQERAKQLDLYVQQKQQCIEVKQKLDDLAHIIQQSKLRDRQLQQELSEVEKQLDAAQIVLQQQTLIQSKNVDFLRSQLKDDQECMVCGSKHHPWRYLQHNHQLLDLQQQQVHFFQMQKEKANQLKEEHQKQMMSEIYQQQGLVNQLSQIENQHHQLLEQLELLGITQDILSQVGDDAKFVLVDQNLNQIEQEIYNQNIQLNQLELVKNKWMVLQQQQEQHQQINQYYHILMNQQHKINEILSTPLKKKWQQNKKMWARQWIDHLQQIHQLEQVYQEKVASQQHIQQQIMLKKQEQNYKHQEIQQLIENKKQIIEQGQELTCQIKKICEQYHQPDESDFNYWHQQVESEIEKLQECLINSKEKYHNQSHELDKNKQKLIVMNEYFQQHQIQLQQVYDMIEQWKKQHTDMNDKLLSDLAQQTDLELKVEQLKQKIEHHDKTLIELQTKLVLIQQKLDQLEITHLMDMSVIHLKLSELKEKQNRANNQRDELATILKVYEKQEEKLKEQTKHFEKIEKEYQRWDRIYSVIGINKGQEFQKFAQQYYLDILLEYANFQMRKLSHRYELHRIENSLSLSITDHDMNDEQRSILSLSGGESFLVSLALALGIAHMASGHLSLDMLFIDEGFGTLDQISLQIVMDTLDRLQGQGRQVIIISHITEIHERIPVQIKIEPKSAGQSEIRIIS